MRARIVGFTRTADWHEAPEHVLRLSAQGHEFGLPTDEETFNRVYRAWVEARKGPDTESRKFLPPTQLEVEIDVTIRRAS